MLNLPLKYRRDLVILNTDFMNRSEECGERQQAGATSQQG
jgi:hypothetical protein